MLLKLLSKETLDIIRKVASNKPTPSLHRPNLNFALSSKRIKSEKPTPCLESKLAELRMGHSSIYS